MRVFDIILKDLKVMLTDKKTLGIMIIMPIILTTILGGALGGMFSSDIVKEPIKIVVVKNYNLDYEKNKFLETPNHSFFLQGIGQEDLEEMQAGMKDFVDDFDVEEMFFDEFLTVQMKDILQYQVLDINQAEELLRTNKISSIVVLPKDFVYNMYVNFFPWSFRNEMEIKVISNPDNYISSQTIEGVMGGFAEMSSIPIVGKTTFFETASSKGIDMMALENLEEVIDNLYSIIEDVSIKIETESVNKQEPLSGVEYYAVAMTAMYILFAAGEGGKLLLEEKDNLTYGRMSVAGISKSEIAIGKYFTIFSFALIQMLIMIVYSTVVLGVDWGNKLLVGLITLCTVFSIAGLGTMLAAVSYRSGNYKMADAFSSILVFLLSLIGGSFIPMEVLPKFMHSLSNAIPNGVALKAYHRVMLGNGLGEILPFLLSLIGTGVIFSLVAIYMLKREGGVNYVKYNSSKASKIEG